MSSPKSRQSTGNDVENASMSPASGLVKRPPHRVEGCLVFSMSNYTQFPQSVPPVTGFAPPPTTGGLEIQGESANSSVGTCSLPGTACKWVGELDFRVRGKGGQPTVTLHRGQPRPLPQCSPRAKLPTAPLAYNAIAQFFPPFNSTPNERAALYLRAKQGFSQFAFPAKE